jgi:hypothetical protein
MKRYNDDNNDPIEWWLQLLAGILLLISCGTLITIGYFTYKIITGVYHLLDKLVDKI